MSRKQILQYWLRELNLLQLAENLRFLYRLAKNISHIARFVRENPDFPIPPAYLTFDAYNFLSYDSYRELGLRTAQYIIALIQQFGGAPPSSILEWGCGPARVIRHIPELLTDTDALVVGTDYNKDTIRWCHTYISNVHFLPNALEPPTPFRSQQFSAIYAISVFTHLSEETSLAWADEIYRILYPNGVFIATLNGDYYLNTLLPHEKAAYHTKGIVIRGAIQEGKKMFSAYHSQTYVRTHLFRNFDVMHFAAGSSEPDVTRQDVWVFRKPQYLLQDVWVFRKPHHTSLAL